ncbi:MAG: hypothetical protein LQ341_004538 [Variospora aurantia]|nr:MAG: hypothetical protein LQ341_004538 [Variospora aurantia]
MSKYSGRGDRWRTQSDQNQNTYGTGSNTFRRQVTLYDAAAGRISTTGFIPSSPQPSSRRDTTSTSYVPLPPEEILFRRRNAPERYEEDDIYFAHENLDPHKQLLPDSDLLKAVHAYASDFYGAVSGKREEGMVSFGSMDETALMAVGVLLEEAVGRLVEGTGDLVFVEGGRRGEDKVLEQLRLKRKTSKEQSMRAKAEERMGAVEYSGGDKNEEADIDDWETSSGSESSASGGVRKRIRMERGDNGSKATSNESENSRGPSDSSESMAS